MKQIIASIVFAFAITSTVNAQQQQHRVIICGTINEALTQLAGAGYTEIEYRWRGQIPEGQASLLRNPKTNQVIVIEMDPVNDIACTVSGGISLRPQTTPS